MLQLPALLARLARQRFLSLLLAMLVATAGLGLAATPAAAQTAPLVYTTSVFLSSYAPATATGEAVMFTGTGKISSRVSRDPDTGASSLVATFDTTGIVGTGYPSLTRYVLNSREHMILPHAALQTVQLSFPMEPAAGSAVTKLRSGTVNLTFLVELITGAVIQISSGTVSLL
jgi:hypothetical protein